MLGLEHSRAWLLFRAMPLKGLKHGEVDPVFVFRKSHEILEAQSFCGMCVRDDDGLDCKFREQSRLYPGDGFKAKEGIPTIPRVLARAGEYRLGMLLGEGPGPGRAR